MGLKMILIFCAVFCFCLSIFSGGIFGLFFSEHGSLLLILRKGGGEEKQPLIVYLST